MRISFSVHINMKASKLSCFNELRSLFFTNVKVEKPCGTPVFRMRVEEVLLSNLTDDGGGFEARGDSCLSQ